MDRQERVVPIYLNTVQEFYDSPKTYKDGQPVYVKNGANWDIYTVRRTDSRQRHAVQLINTGVTTV